MTVPCANGFWHRKFGTEIDKHIWSLPSLVTKETRLRVLQWKLLHNIYPTNILLCKMKVRDDQMLWCSRLHWAFLFWLPADSEVLEIYRTIHFDYFRHSDSFNYCWCFVRNKTEWLQEGQNQTNKSYNFNSENVYKYLQKDSHSCHCPWYLKISSGFDTFRRDETSWKCVYHDHIHTQKAETNTHRHSSTHTHTHTSVCARTHAHKNLLPTFTHIHALCFPFSPVVVMSHPYIYTHRYPLWRTCM